MSDDVRPEASGEVADSDDDGFLKKFGPLLKSWVIFLVVLGVMIAIYEANPRLVNRRFAMWTAELMGGIMNLLGEESWVRGIMVSCSVCRFRIIGECTAYYPISIYIAAVLGFPSPWRRRVLGVLLGLPVLLIINQVRLVSLCYLSRSVPEYFDMLHIVVWQSLIIFFTVLVWILWVMTIGRKQ